MLDSSIGNPKKSGAQKRLEDIENKLRELMREKKKLWKEFAEKDRELEVLRTGYKKNLEEAEKLQNQLILIWDYWYREVQILMLEKKEQASVLPSERGTVVEERLKLIKHNETLEKGFKKREIDAEILDEIKKRLGIWEGKEEKN